ncbi:MAG TPA: oligosaccharide flippase family protein, partial [Smithella sp.]|nr:oligosaccharide flippase family protein [Smithella sp.]
MLRAFFRDSVVYAIPAFVNRGMSIFLVPLYTRVLKPADYGVLDMLMVFGSLVNLTVALEVSQGVAIHYTDEISSDKKILYASTAFWFTLFCYTLFLFIGLIFAPFLSQWVMGIGGLEFIFRLGILYIWFNGLFYLIQNQYRFELRSKGYAMVTILVSTITAVVSVFLAYGLSWGLPGILYGMVAGGAIGCIYGFWGLRSSFRLRFDGARLKEMLTFSIPLVPSGIAVFISLYINRLMINHYLTLGDVGLFGIGFRLASIIGLVMVGFQGAMMPLVYSHYREEQTPRHLALIFRLFIAFSLLVFIGLTVFAKEILWIMTTPAYYSSQKVVIFLVPAILLSNMYIFAPGIGIARKTHLILWINLGGAAVNTLLNWLLIPMFGIEGAAVSTLLGYACVFAAYMYFSQRLYHVPHNWIPIFLSVLIAFFLAFLGTRLTVGAVMDVVIKVTFLCGAVFIFMVTGLVSRFEILKAF